MIGGRQLLQHASLLMKLEGKSFWMVGWGEENSRRKKKKEKEKKQRRGVHEKLDSR
jgi:hypothetical protein